MVESERAAREEGPRASATPRRARPHRPELGEWDGPIHGELGVLAHDDDRVQCHCCAGWYKNLAGHAWLRHDLTADEYRAIFGLRHHTGLVGSGLSEVRRQNSAARLQAFYPLYAHNVTDLTTEERSARRKADPPLALEARRDPANLQTWRANLAKGHERLRELRQDPEFRRRAALAESLAKGGRVAVVCAGCGARFELTRSAARDGERHFCGEPCLRAFRRAWAEELERRRRAKPSPTVELVCRACGGAFRGRVGRLYCSPLCRSRGKRRSREVPLTCRTCGQSFQGDPRQEFCSLACHGRSPRPDARAKMRDAARRRGRPHLEELRAMAADAFADLPDLPRRAVRLYYGLEDGGPRTQREIARMCGIAQVRVQPIVAETVERLLRSTRS
jgi:hypothetical protein